MNPVKIGRDVKRLQGNQLRKWRKGCVTSGIWKAGEPWYWKLLSDETENVTRSGLLFVRMAIETFERSVPKLPLQPASPILPPVTCTEWMAVKTWITPEIQHSLAKWTRSLVRFVGRMWIGIDTGVSHSRLEGGSGESGSSIAGIVIMAREADGSLPDTTVIGESSTEILPTLRTPHRPTPFQISVQIRSLSSGWMRRTLPISNPTRPSTLSHTPSSFVAFNTSTRSGPSTNSPRSSMSWAVRLETREE